MQRDYEDLRPTRRELLQLSAAGVVGTSFSGWLPRLAARAADAKAVTGKARAKACIVLWMDGGPPHTDTFDLKPEVAECGIFKPIASSLPGVEISELLPQFAKLMDRATLIRSMQTIENEHLRARYHLRTGYRDGAGGVSYPSIGTIVSSELSPPKSDIPGFVAIADRRDRSHGPGYLGTAFQPLYVLDPAKGVENLNATTDAAKTNDRLALLADLEKGFRGAYGATLADQHRTVYDRAVQLMRSEKAKAFDLSSEPESLKKRYGDEAFGRGCLMARRLVETGVKFIEVTLGGWDTHFENNDAIRKLCGKLDPAMSTLVEDLEDRGLLDETLVVWMGEFGRTPKFKGKGRDHYAKAWTTMLMGGGAKRGQVIGRTDDVGAIVADRPVSVADFMATVCTALGIDPAKEQQLPDGRPLPIVEKSGKAIDEVFA
jgi:hypothetical protein